MEDEKIIKKLNESLMIAKSALSAMESLIKMMEKGDTVIKGNLFKDRIKTLEINHMEEDEKIIEGFFDGKNMVSADESQYPVQANYASKSKLVYGDKLKLTIKLNGAFVYKQIELIPRKLLTGNLILDGSQYKVLTKGKEYNVLYASVTFFRANVGDEVTIIVPESGEADWAVIENILPGA